MNVTDTEGAITIRTDDEVVARYRAETSASKPHFETVAIPPTTEEIGGRNLIQAAPHDHSWHLGLFFCQKLVDGINCWESEREEATGNPYGFATNQDYEVDHSNEKVTITQQATWQKESGEQLLQDERELGIHGPMEDSYLITWQQELDAVDQTRYLSSETLHGHYSGFSARFIWSMANGRVLLPNDVNPNAEVSPRQATGPSAEWCDYSGPLDGKLGTGDPWSAGITLMSHPESDDYPVNWFTMREPFGFIAANPTWQTVLTLHEDDPLSWQWGAWVHAGTPDREEIREAYASFEDAI